MPHYDCPCMEKCPLHYAMSVIGGKWKVQIVCALTNAGGAGPGGVPSHGGLPLPAAHSGAIERLGGGQDGCCAAQ